MSYSLQLNELITTSVIPDIEERMDELYAIIADKKNDLLDEIKEELTELTEFRDDLREILVDIECDEITTEECKEIIDDILQAQRDDEE